jgi:hypothetical protein
MDNLSGAGRQAPSATPAESPNNAADDLDLSKKCCYKFRTLSWHHNVITRHNLETHIHPSRILVSPGQEQHAHIWALVEDKMYTKNVTRSAWPTANNATLLALLTLGLLSACGDDPAPSKPKRISARSV